MTKKKINHVVKLKNCRGDRGMVFAEMAIGALLLGVFLVFLGGLFQVVFCQIDCTDAASEIARQAARSDQGAVDAVKADLPEQAAVSIHDQGDLTVATVTIELTPWGRFLPAITVGATAEVMTEKGGI